MLKQQLFTTNYTLFSVMKLLLIETISRWAQWFREDREEIEDEERFGRPVTESIPEISKKFEVLLVMILSCYNS